MTFHCPGLSNRLIILLPVRMQYWVHNTMYSNHCVQYTQLSLYKRSFLHREHSDHCVRAPSSTPHTAITVREIWSPTGTGSTVLQRMGNYNMPTRRIFTEPHNAKCHLFIGFMARCHETGRRTQS